MPESMREAMEKVAEHTEQISELQEESTRFKAWQIETEKRLVQGENNYQDLKNTILLANQDMRTFFVSTMDKQWDLIKSRDLLSENEKVRRYEMGKSKLEKYSEMVIKLGGAGGILIVIAQLLFGK